MIHQGLFPRVRSGTLMRVTSRTLMRVVSTISKGTESRMPLPVHLPRWRFVRLQKRYRNCVNNILGQQILVQKYFKLKIIICCRKIFDQNYFCKLLQFSLKFLVVRPIDRQTYIDLGFKAPSESIKTF